MYVFFEWTYRAEGIENGGGDGKGGGMWTFFLIENANPWEETRSTGQKNFHFCRTKYVAARKKEETTDAPNGMTCRPPHLRLAQFIVNG